MRSKPLYTSLFVSLIIGLYLVSPVPATSQTGNCTVDTSEISALLLKAQTQAAAGDSQGAVENIQAAQKLVDAIDAQCGRGDTVSALDISQTFSEPNNKFTIQFPLGWIPQQIVVGGLTTTGFSNTVGQLFFGSALNEAKDAQAVLVAVESARNLAANLLPLLNTKNRDGAGNTDTILYEQVDVVALLRVLAARADATLWKFGSIETLTVNEQLAATVTFTYSTGGATVIEGTFAIMKMTGDQFALLWGYAALGHGQAVDTLTRAMLPTLQLKQ